jgi:hypothetical protein
VGYRPDHSYVALSFSLSVPERSLAEAASAALQAVSSLEGTMWNMPPVPGDAMQAPPSKLDVARRQLGTALALFLDDSDPVSVHVLACGGGEIAEHLAEVHGGAPFRSHLLASNPGLDAKKLRGIRNRHWNAFKHATKHNGREREDSELIAAFSDTANDHHLFIGWYDYGAAAGRLPIEAQAFQVWYLALYPEKQSAHANHAHCTALFPDLPRMSRPQQKARLREEISKARSRPDVMSDPRTERRYLILSGFP